MISRWLTGLVALVLLAALAIMVGDPKLAVEIWGLLIVFAVAARLTGSRSEPIADTGARATSPQDSAQPPDTQPPVTPRWDAQPVDIAAPEDRARPMDPSNQAPAATDLFTHADVPPAMTTWRQPTVITSDEAAALLRVAHTDIIGAIQEGQLPGNRIGEHWRLRTQSVLAWLDGPYGAHPDRRAAAQPQD